ncbi:GNAT family N-acetyltransferase [Photobacterium rosenbergii]|uniref:GNAT family N-acetyltransferase n=1 Tax=Photobacterium rosenbergii TaxID=294936 RepID=UPI001C99B9B2|nr:GNAT family N-acetyltransferase [Photobacterium rosenbergii]MBY5947634.1 GNAT family N-acetyltransferase [Photobacterium rosenbergii]
MNIHIKYCTYDQHAPEMLDIFNDAILNTTALYEYEPRTMETMDHWFASKIAGEYPVIGAFDDNGTLMGFASLGQFRPQAAFRFTAEHSIYIADGFRGKGIAVELMKTLIILASRLGYRSLVGAIDLENMASLRLHQKFGFEEAGVIKAAGFKFDRWLDLAFYQLSIDEMAG